MKFRILFLSWILSFCIYDHVDAHQNANLWLKTTVSTPTFKKLKADIEYEHRRQSGFENHNPVDHTLMNSFRIWTHYQHNDKIRFTAVPFSYFSNFRAIRKLADEDADPRGEYRFGAAVEFQNNLAKKLKFLSRQLIEYRVFQKGQNNVTRLRNRLGLRYDISPKTRVFLYDEVMVNLSGTTLEHFFDHNRLGINLEYFIIPNFKVDAQYMYATRLPLNNTAIFSEHNFLLYFTYIIPKKKKDTIN